MDLAALALDDAWLDLLDEVARAEGLPTGRLAEHVRAVSDAYNAGDFAAARGDAAFAARLAFFFPRDVPKVAGAVRELVATGKLALPAEGALRVLDVGAGLGASTWGLVRALAIAGQRGRVEAVLVDKDARALHIAMALATRRAAEREVAVRVTTAARPEGVYDVVLVGQSLGEMRDDVEGQATVLADLFARTERTGSLVVVEPALRDRTRRLHAVRDRLLVQGATVFAPCLHAQPCPALADDDAWCHEDLRVDLPPRVAAIARAAGLRWQGLTFSYLVLRKDGVTLQHVLGFPGLERVVSAPIVTKGKRELFLCSGGVRRKVARLDRDGTRKDVFSRAERGDILSCDPPLAASTTRIPPGTLVRRS